MIGPPWVRAGRLSRPDLRGNASGPAAAVPGPPAPLGWGRRGGSGVVHKLRPAQRACNSQTYLRKKWTSSRKCRWQLRKWTHIHDIVLSHDS